MFPYNPCMVVGDDIWVAGQIGIDGGDSMAKQATSALSKIDVLLGEAGADKADLVMVMVLLEDMAEFGEFNDVYAAWLEGTIPCPCGVWCEGITCGCKGRGRSTGCTGFRGELSLQDSIIWLP